MQSLTGSPPESENASPESLGPSHRWPTERIDQGDWCVHTPEGPVNVTGREAAKALAAVPAVLVETDVGTAALEGQVRRRAERTIGLLRIAGLGRSAACMELESRLGRRRSA